MRVVIVEGLNSSAHGEPVEPCPWRGQESACSIASIASTKVYRSGVNLIGIVFVLVARRSSGLMTCSRGTLTTGALFGGDLYANHLL